jgi:hypothetical protein
VRRGFKAEAERVATTVRKGTGKRPSEHVDAVEMARHIGAEVRCADELTSLAKLEELDALQPGAFSACTFSVGGRHIVVYKWDDERLDFDAAGFPAMPRFLCWAVTIRIPRLQSPRRGTLLE